MRLFIAFELELKVKETLLSIQKQVASDKRSKVRWMGSQQLHLTLKFLGEVSNDKLDSIKQGFQQAVLGISPFQLKILGSGCFPGRGSVRIIWAGVEKPWESILACSDRVESVCQELGFEREKRSFTPHITVARVKFDNSKGNLRSAVEAAFFEPVEQRVQSICLYKSTLQPSGAQYDIIHREALLG